MASNEVDGNQEPNQSKVSMMISNRSLLNRSAKNLMETLAHSVCAVRDRLVAESIACKITD